VYYDLNLFREREKNTEKVIIRLNKAQRDRVLQMAERAGMSASKFIISLIGAEHEKQMEIVERYVDILDMSDDNLPF
jgi:hypothetical protein